MSNIIASAKRYLRDLFYSIGITFISSLPRVYKALLDFDERTSYENFMAFFNIAKRVFLLPLILYAICITIDQIDFEELKNSFKKSEENS